MNQPCNELIAHLHVQSVGVSAVSGEGMTELFAAVDKCRAEYDKEYLPILQARQQVRYDSSRRLWNVTVNAGWITLEPV